MGERERERERASSHLETLDGREKCQWEGQRGGGTELPQLAARDAAPVDGPGVAHLQHQVHGPLAGHAVQGKTTEKIQDTHDDADNRFPK